MNETSNNQKLFFLVTTPELNWGKGETIKQAMKNAKCRTLKKNCCVAIFITESGTFEDFLKETHFDMFNITTKTENFTLLTQETI